MRTEFADGAWTVHQIFAGLTLEKYPALVPEIHIFMSVVRGEADREQINFTLTAPNGDIVAAGGMMMNFDTGDIAESGQLLQNLIFRTTGTYSLRLFTGKTILLERAIEMR